MSEHGRQRLIGRGSRRSNPTDVIAQPTTLPAMRRYSEAVLRMEELGAGQWALTKLTFQSEI